MKIPIDPAYSIAHPAMIYLTTLSPENADRLLMAVEALREWLWSVHGDAIADLYGEQPFFAEIHTEDPSFLKKDTL